MNARRYLAAGVSTEHRPAIRSGRAMAERVPVRPQAVRLSWRRRLVLALRGDWSVSVSGVVLVLAILLAGVVL